MSANRVISKLKGLSDPEFARGSSRFNKTGPGEYAEQDKFLGIRVPLIREQVKHFSSSLDLKDQATLLQNEWHEIRLFALLSMVNSFKHSPDISKGRITTRYLALKKHINGWDLVDSSAPQIVGGWYVDKDRSTIDKMIDSNSLWDRRIAILSTFHYLRLHDFDDTYRYAEQLMNDREDLIHKACGWMLREAGKRDEPRLLIFLDQRCTGMPRTMLRYSIEKLKPSVRQQFLRKQ